MCAKKTCALVARIKKDMGRGRPPILRKLSFKLHAINIMALNHVLLIMRIIKDKNKHGWHYAWKV